MNTVPANLGIAVLSRLLLGGISLIIIGLLTRTLGPTAYGYYSLIFAYLFVFSTLADLGLYTVMVREISQPAANQSTVVSNIFSLRLAVLAVLLALGLGLAWLLPYPPLVRWGLSLASAATALASLVQVLTGIFQKYLRLYYLSTADVLARLVQLGLVAWLATRQLGLLPFLGAVVIAELAHFLLVLYWARQLIPFRLAADLTYWRRTAVTALPIAVSLVFVLLYFKLDTVLLSLLKPPADVGVYALAYKVLETIIFLPALYVGLIMPLLSRHARAAPVEFGKVFQKSFDQLAILAWPVTLYLMLRAPDLIRIIGGGAFGAAAGVLTVLAPAVGLIFFGNLGGNALVALDLQRRGMWLYLAGAVCNVGANLLFIPRYSYYAAAWTTVLTELLITVGLFWLVHYYRAATVRWSVFVKAGLAAALVAMVLHPLRLPLVWATLLALTYFPLLYLFGGFSRADVREWLTLRAPALPAQAE